MPNKQLPHEWMQDQLTPENIEEIYSKPLPSQFSKECIGKPYYPFGEQIVGAHIVDIYENKV